MSDLPPLFLTSGTHTLLSGLAIFAGWFPHNCFSLSFCALWFGRFFLLLIIQAMSGEMSLRRGLVVAHVKSFLAWQESRGKKRFA